MTVLRPCLICGSPSANGSRCATHAVVRDRPSSSRQGWDRAWQRLSRLARERQPWCSWCGATEDLTGDHLRWPAESLDDVQVLCRSCNSRKGPLRARVRVEGGEGPPRGRGRVAAGEAFFETDREAGGWPA